MKKYYWWAALAVYVILVLSLARIVTDKTDCGLNYLPCLEANGLGDFLAGAFAPLAFVWLARAVYMQSSQLEMQKEELRLTREEMVLARQVAEETKKEIKAQADAMVLQKDILQAQLDAERQVRADAEFNALKTPLLDMLKSINNQAIIIAEDVNELDFQNKPKSYFWYLLYYSKQIDSDGFIFKILSDKMYDYDKADISKVADDKKINNLRVNQTVYKILFDIKLYTEQIINISLSASPSTQSYVALSRFDILNKKVVCAIHFAELIVSHVVKMEDAVKINEKNDNA